MYIEKKRTSLYYIALLFFLIFKINLNESHSQFCNSSIGVAKHLNYEGRKEQVCNNGIIKREYIKYICKPSNNNNNNGIRNRKLNHVLTIEDYTDGTQKNGKTKKHKYNFLSNQHSIVKKHKNNIAYKNWKVQKISVLNYSVNNINIAPILWGKNDTNLIIKKCQLRKKNTNIPIYLMTSTDATIMDINVSPDISSHIETDRTRKICIKAVENNTSNKLKSNDDDDQKIKTNQDEKKKKNSTKRVLSEESKKSMKEKLRSIMIKKWKDADFRKKMIKSFKKRGAHHNKKISDTIKNKWKNDKDYKLKTLEGQRKYFIKKCKNNNAISSKTREKISRSMKLYWQNKNKYKPSQPNNLQSIIKKKKQKKVWENIYSIILNKNVNDFNNYQTFHHNLSINLQAALG
ncbi:conserved Plasmodium protein, unknown function [Plasmodium yoelii]|uniref:Uncharacterized protein n=2 Tax=Plasmodium yoelii TaxID=5861 RepID=A0AAE9WQM4_PLAYO|nr:conserved Plasmodium protein, unknown function [Plasmodium yoelii]WBY56679.1 hypothetical protein Py17XNL_000801723 [Plasmodium yoelii yoelii]CDU17519.1 conserved Plasmodium protein, unknown function [Plasmodium yoelii]VTZ77314.1 conserved Plasmodium protein, unknown function [Plasmodium yoelii]|eukprot:XP_022811943.1 conserved Plasmodium protein, unknown function [Plasmodium yoelii]